MAFARGSPGCSWAWALACSRAALCRNLVNSTSPGSVLLTLGFAGLGLPYILAALLMTFLHDRDLAANPLGVFTALFQLGSSFLLLCAFIACLLAAVEGIFVLVFMLRNDYFKTYLLASVPFWTLFVWITIVVMRLLGNYYHPRQKALGWIQDRPRWGVLWKL